MRPIRARIVHARAQPSKVVIVGGGPAGIHFAKRLKDEGYSSSDITVLEAQPRLGGKSFTEFLPSQPGVRHELGTCYMHMGYDPVRKLLEEYGMGDDEVELGRKYLDRERNGKQRKVWELQEAGDYTRADLKGQDFDDWAISAAEEKEKAKFGKYYGEKAPSPSQRRSKLFSAAKQQPRTFVKGLRILRDPTGNTLDTPDPESMSDKDIVEKLERLEQAVAGVETAIPEFLTKFLTNREAKRTRGAGTRDADFEDLPGMEMEGANYLNAGLNVVLQMGRYVEEHEKLFGQYDYGLPPEPNAAQLAEINMPFKEWLDSKDLDALTPFFVYSQAAQGYGSLEKVPALYGLWWNHPNYVAPAVGVNGITTALGNILFNGLFGQSFLRPPAALVARLALLVKAVLNPLYLRFSSGPAAQAVLEKQGFNQLWRNIVDKEELEVLTSSRVTNIDRSGPSPTVTYINTDTNEQTTISDIDFVVLAVPLLPAMQGVTAYTKGSAPGKAYEEPVVDEVTRGDPIFTPTAEERDVLSTINSYTLKTVLFTADPFPEPGPIYPGEVWAQALEGYGGRIRYLTNSELSTRGTESPGPTGYVSYQALDEPPNVANDAALKAHFESDIAAIGLTNVNIVLEKPWYYFPHFPQEAVQAKAPWRLMEVQGAGGMFFAGSSCCFESVLDVMAYNDLLIDKLLLQRGAAAVPETAEVTAAAPEKEIAQ